jgi:hypothetical protein
MSLSSQLSFSGVQTFQHMQCSTALFDSDCEATDESIFMKDLKVSLLSFLSIHSSSRSTYCQVSARDSQPTASELARYGIKARDFYYESDLPPIRSAIHLQVQPGPASQKHDRESTPEITDHPPKRPRTLARVPTEIVEESSLDVPSRGILGRRSSSRLRRCSSMLSTFSPKLKLLPHSQSALESDNRSMIRSGSFSFDARFRIRPPEASSSQLDSASQTMNPSRSFYHLGFTIHASQSHAPFSSPHLVRYSSCDASARLSRQTPSLITPVSSFQQTPAPRYYLRQRKPISYLMSTKSKCSRRQGTIRASSNIKQSSMCRPSKSR